MIVYVTSTINPSLGGLEVVVHSEKEEAIRFAEHQSERYFPTPVWECEVDGAEGDVVWSPDTDEEEEEEEEW